MRFKKILLIILVILGSVWSSCNVLQQENSNIVATINNEYNIAFDELQEYVLSWKFTRKYRDVNEAYNNALGIMITNQLKRIDFFEQGLDKDTRLMQHINRIINEELVTEYYNYEFVKKYSNEEYAKEAYKLMDRRVAYLKLLLSFPKDCTMEQEQAIKQRALQMKSEIENGKDFGLVAQENLQGFTTKDLYTQYLEWEQSFTSPFENTIFNMNSGEIRVLTANGGVNLVMVTGVEKIKVGPFDDIKNDIMKKLETLNRDLKYSDFETFKEKLIDESDLEWNDYALRQLAEWANDPRFFDDNANFVAEQEIAKKNLTVLTYADGKVDVKEFNRLINEVLGLTPPTTVKPSDIKKYILDAKRTEVISQKARALGLERNIFNPNASNPVLQNVTTTLYNAAMIDSQIPKTNDTILHDFYEVNRDSLYFQFKKVNIYAIIYSDEAEANDAMQKISNGMAFEKVASRLKVKAFVRNKEGVVESYLSPEKPYLGDAAIGLQLGEIAGPIKYNDPEMGDQYAIIKCVETRPEKQLEFADVKNRIIDDYINYYKRKGMKKVREQLWEKYDVTIHEKVLSAQLQPNQ